MLLSQTDFTAALRQNRLKITLIGMSNIGKSYTAARIAKAYGFECHEIDVLIAKELEQKSMQAMADWLGYPYEANYADKAKQYLCLEEQFSLSALKSTGNQVIDTTGSVIHTSEKTKLYINNNSLVVYIRANPDDINRLKEQYFAVPKPTIWGDSYREFKGFSPQKSMLICYTNLLEKRANLYEAMSDLCIDSDALRASSLKDDQILTLLQSQLSQNNT